MMLIRMMLLTLYCIHHLLVSCWLLDMERAVPDGPQMKTAGCGNTHDTDMHNEDMTMTIRVDTMTRTFQCSARHPGWNVNMVAEHGGSTGQSCSSCGSSSRPSRSRSSTLGVPGGELRLCCSRRPEKQSGEEQRQREMHNGPSGRGILDRNLQERAHSLADRRARARRARRRA